MSGRKETERVPAELILMSLLKERDMGANQIYHAVEKRSDYRIYLSRTMIGTYLHRLEEKGYVQSYSVDTGAPIRRKKTMYHLHSMGELAQDMSYEEYLSTVSGVLKLLNSVGDPEKK